VAMMQVVTSEASCMQSATYLYEEKHVQYNSIATILLYLIYRHENAIIYIILPKGGKI
jgi:hypothetical protein